MNVLEVAFLFIVFPGFVFTTAMGIVSSWVDRKVTARVQYRVGPPLLQPLYDLIKLLGKEPIVPKEGSVVLFLLSPLFAVASITLASTILLSVNLLGKTGFVGDLIVIIYLLTIPSLSMILGASASANPLASLGASREMKLILSYEPAFILAVFAVVMKAGGVINLSRIVDFQVANGALAGSISGCLAFIVAILCTHAKLALVPFDVPEAETEIMGGTLIEYSGAPLALFKLTKNMMLFVLPVFLIHVFLGGFRFDSISTSVFSIIKYVLLLTVFIVLRNTNPRLRIDQIVKFFWGPVMALAVIAAVLAILGF